VSAPDISGTLTAAQIASVAASQVTGQLTSAQVASISAAQLTGQITGTQISNGSISTPQLAAGAVTAATIAANTITASQIAAGAITASELAAGAVVAGKIAAGAIQAGDIAAGTITGDRIAANTVTAAQIAANTITAGQLAANTVTAGQIAAGAIGAQQIAADSICAANLVVANFDNLVPNPNSSMTPPAGGWPSGAWESVGLTYNAGYACRVAYNNAWTQITPMIPCNPGDQFYFACNAFCWPSGGSGVSLDWWNASGGWIAAVQGSEAPNAWSPISVTTPALPSGVAFITLSLRSFATTGSWYKDLYLRRMADANLIVDGSITATKIAAGAITADMITTGTLNAANVAVTNLNASNITTGTLSASKVLFADGTALTTASRVQTSMLHETATATTSGAGNPGTAIAGLTCSVTAASTADTFNMFGALSGGQTVGTPGYGCNVNLYVDGTFNQSIQVSYATLNGTQSNAFIMSLTGLSAGTHTLTFYLQAANASQTFQSYVGSTLLLQRVF
jgi:hypothetical protein